MYRQCDQRTIPLRSATELFLQILVPPTGIEPICRSEGFLNLCVCQFHHSGKIYVISLLSHLLFYGRGSRDRTYDQGVKVLSLTTWLHPYMVLAKRIELSQCFHPRILSPLCLPVPSHQQIYIENTVGIKPTLKNRNL